VLFVRDVAAIMRKIQCGVRFAVLAITVGQLADKMCFIAPFGPCLAQIKTNRYALRLSLRGASFATKQSLADGGDCFAKSARNDSAEDSRG